jgi:hypothetical protein
MSVLVNTEEFRETSVPSLGLLVGLCLPDSTDGPSHVILGRCHCVVEDKDGLPALSSHGLSTPKWVESWRRVRGCFPGGCDVCGVWVCVKGGEKEIITELVKTPDLLELVGEKPLVIVQSERLSGYRLGELGSLEEVGVAPVVDYLTTNTCLLRVSSSLPAIADPRQTTQDQLLGQLPSNVPAFLLPSLSFLLPHPSHNIKCSHQTLRDVLQSSSVGQEPFLRVELLEVPEECANPLTLSISSPLTGSRAELHIPVDTLTLLHLDFPLEEVGVVLWTAVKKQFEAVTTAMLWKPGCLHNVAIHHFPPSSPHLCPLSVPYPHCSVAQPDSLLDDTALASVRRDWHTALAFSSDLPKLRLTNTHCFFPPPVLGESGNSCLTDVAPFHSTQAHSSSVHIPHSHTPPKEQLLW